MGIGALFTAFIGSRTDKMISVFLSFGGGVMMSIVLLELIPESIANSNTAVTVAGLVAGALMVWAFNYVIDKISDSNKLASKLRETRADKSKNSMLRSGILMLFAIGLHNIPEGLALGAVGYHETSFGAAFAVIIGLHNIPEGMAVAAPLIAGGLSKTKSIALTLIVGATTVAGAAVGVAVGGISYIASAVFFSVAGGTMLYVVFGEMLPQSILSSNNRVPMAAALAGIIAGLLFTEIII